MRKELYNEGDYVKYIGDYSTTDEVRRNPDFAKIISILKTENYWIVSLNLFNSDEKLSCLISFIRPIHTKNYHLEEIGFEKKCANNINCYYQLNSIKISSISIKRGNHIFISGLCLSNFNELEEKTINEYFKNGEFDVDKFYSEFPNFNNINDLFDFLTANKIAFSKKEVIKKTI